ncbi:tRNA dimethylallyltransferase [Anaerosporobacter mobilis DSM 15930]|jgi:tRNA dimethylallyltransferase|uniref:tRNA dimethylallyltransferase n=1 Tax=Anaerosporobacter mobilis DSM 15930 TaxID=1120996 RepID=A0A1M7GTI0_9FIRM|nr:tRNA (adenosine(37)-N6)-dimethylallyltransferase MiaA [Anaerosporobacter mobilis]SHM19169.1 tRNA dimethylallyltransferase [Anaerosporobacter mobilis DSM 15930]
MDKGNKPLIILTGPTAVGKTALSIRLAKAINGEIISADSMQVYKKMDIGTAKIMPTDMQGVKHYLIDEFMPDEDFNVVKFKQLALTYMNEIYAKGKIPILVGGTGFYIQAILNDIDFTQTVDDTSYREHLQQVADEKGAEFLYEQLREVDEEATKTIHQNNVKRVIRALEYYHQTGKKISEHNEEQKQKESPYNFAYFVLNHDRSILYDRIDKRIDIMMEQGLLDEVTSLYKKGYSKELVSMQGLGYKEILAYLEGECTLEEAIYVLKRDTRHFAKRQLTWFKRERDVIWLNKSEFEDNEDAILEKMCETLHEKKIM